MERPRHKHITPVAHHDDVGRAGKQWCQTPRRAIADVGGGCLSRGDGHKQAMITEGGWNDHPRWTRAVKPAQRIDYTLRAYDIANEEWPWLDALAMWVFRFPWDAKSYQDYYTFVRTDFEPKPIYLEVQSKMTGGPPDPARTAEPGTDPQSSESGPP